MHKELAKSSASIFLAFCVLSTLFYNTARADSGVTYKIADIQIQLSDNTLNYTISGNSVPAYTVSERFSPFRAVIDIAGGSFSEDFSQSKAALPGNEFAALKLSNIKGQDPAILRFEFSLADSHDYSVTRNGNNLMIKIDTAREKAPVSSSSKSPRRVLTDFNVTTTPNTTTIVIASDSKIENYSVDTIGKGANRPPRMFIDIKAVDIKELVREKNIGTSVDKIRVAARGNGARIVFDSASAKLFRYTVTPSQKGLVVVIDESDNTIPQLSKSSQKTKPGNSNAKSDVTLDSLIDSLEQSTADPSAENSSSAAEKKTSSMADDFSFSGYNKQRISVDFYKIDIHNVFRLFRQITDLNIIVDAGVNGSLTLALTDVPWDFALDIILNLMNLKKEERFNTVVIYPAKKDFSWPTRAEDNLDFEADVEVVEQESLIIEQTATVSKEIMQAKEYLMKAQMLGKNEDYEEAALLYTKAWELWPDNIKLSNRLATLYLVHLGMNAKAVYYAQESLRIDPKNSYAALYAAIGSANMQRISEASEYFAQSISTSPPMKEALISYAAFSENNSQNDAALKLLDKYHSHYGETVDTMIAKARILDKLGLKKEAEQQYIALLGSGFQLRPDLKKYIQSRIAEKE
jgi:type IV pilus assembly protein PilQ